MNYKFFRGGGSMVPRYLVQIYQNPRPSKKSTGPKTPAGKAKVAKNSIKHGLFASALAVSVGDGKEDFTEYSALYEALMNDLSPMGKMQELLAEKIAVDHWRLKRLLGYEAGEIFERSHKFKKEAIDHHLNPSPIFFGEEKPSPEPLVMLGYDEEISDETLNKQKALVIALGIPERDLSSIDFVLEMIIHGYVLDEEIGETDIDKAKNMLKNWSTEENEELRKSFLDSEEACLKEMLEVRRWAKTFDRHGRVKCIPNGEDLEKITKYEKALENSIFKNLAALKTLQTN